MNEFNYLTGAAQANEEVQKKDSLLHITALAEEWLRRKEEYERLEEEAKAAKIMFNKVSQEDIPNAMMEVGLKEIKLATGQKVSFKEDVSCSVKDYDKLDEFLSSRGDDGIMKVTLEIGKTPKSILSQILGDLSMKYGISAAAKQAVHPMTMSSYIKKLCGIDGKTVAEINVADIDEDMLTVFRFYKTTIK